MDQMSDGWGSDFPVQLQTQWFLSAQPEDFRVEEIEAYPCSGQGEHLYLQIEKRECMTEWVKTHLADFYQVSNEDIGYAGRKDKASISRQWFSVRLPNNTENVTPKKSDQFRILQLGRHGNKLRKGHLKENRFRITLKRCSLSPGADPSHPNLVADRLSQLVCFGIPNFFGSQRFGTQKTAGPKAEKGAEKSAEKNPEKNPEKINVQLGKLLAHNHKTEFFKLLAEAEKMNHPPASLKQIGTERIRFYLSALQSHLFNRYLEERGNAFHIPLAGERSTDGIPMGPIFGQKMTPVTGEANKLEERVLKSEGLSRKIFETWIFRNVPGTRRPLVIHPTEAEAQPLGDHQIQLRFTLPPGCYATNLVGFLTGRFDRDRQDPGFALQ